MIARIWRGMTPATKAEEYLDYLKKTGLKDYSSIPGNQGVFVLRRIKGELIIIPRGVEHRPVAGEEVHIILFEPVSTVNAGNFTNERTIKELGCI